ncbi:MAG: hypothetical protein IBJ14_05675 [Hydrogenophaga sp.]|nr:hypothetical protein [Hydrogenophaga sp.]
MTILNIHLEQRRAIVASNTQGARPDGTQGNGSKIFALPHASAVVAGRGQLGISFAAYAECHALMADLDGLIDRIAEIAKRQMGRYREAMANSGVSFDPETEIVLVGWSPKRKEMVAHRCHVNAEGAITEHAVGGYFAPWEAQWGAAPSIDATSASLTSAAKVQAEHAERVYPGMGWLGDLMLCEITPESITFTSAKNFHRP